MSDGLRVLIADDERPARQKIRRFIERDEDVRVIHEAADGVQALDVIRAECPDVVFLDIHMPGATGIEVAEALGREDIGRVIFVTAYDEYAVRAFDLHAMDYLLKPFNYDRFHRAWRRVRRSLEAEQRVEHLGQLRDVLTQLHAPKETSLQRVMVDHDGRTVLLELKRVSRIDASKNYVVLHTPDHAFRFRTTLGDLEDRLDPQQFVRVNRSAIVNVQAIVELEPAGHGDYDIRLRDRTVVRLSRRYKHRLAPWTG